MVFTICIHHVTLEFGNHTPLGVQCIDTTTTLDDLISFNPTHKELLLDLFSGRNVHHERKALEALDKYLDIPFVESYLNPTSYAAFHRLVHNQCTIFPPYNLEQVDFCREAAARNHVDTLQKAYEKGCFWDNSVVQYAIHHRNIDMIQFVIDHHGQLHIDMKYCVRANDMTILCKLLPFQPESQPFTFNCYVEAAKHNSLEMLKFMKSNLGTLNGYNDTIEQEFKTIAQHITSLGVYQFFRDHYEEMYPTQPNRFQEYTHIYIHNAIQYNVIDLFIHLWTPRMINEEFVKRLFSHDEPRHEMIKHLLSHGNNVMQTCGNNVMQTCGNTVMQTCGNTVMQTCGNLKSWRWNDLMGISSLPHCEHLITYLESHPFVTSDDTMTHIDNGRKAPINYISYSGLLARGHTDICTRLGLQSPHYSLLEQAINNNQMKVVRYLQSLGCSWPKKQLAAQRNHFAMLQYIHENGFQCDGTCHMFYHASRIPFCPNIPDPTSH